MAKKGRPVGSKNKKSMRFNSKSKPMGVERRNSTRATVIAHLEKFGYITKQSAEDLYNVNNFYQVISNLRGDGFHIELKRGVNGVAEYHLLNEKDLFQDATVPMEWSEVVKDVNKPEPKVEVEPEDMKVRTSMKEVILDHLKKHKTITSVVAMKKYRCLNLCTIIGTLRDEGYNISRSRERKSSDYNTASNRNNSYVVYTLEDKARKIKSYTINCVCEGAVSMLMEPFAPAYKTIGDAINTAVNKATKLAKYCNAFYGTSTVDFIVNNSTDGVWLRKREIIKKLFRKTYSLTTLAHFTFGEIEVDI